MSDDEPRATIVTVATLFDSATNERIAVTETFPDYTELAAEFMWTEGNYACDCNRRLFISQAKAKAAGVEWEPFESSPCGDTIRLESLEITVKGET